MCVTAFLNNACVQDSGATRIVQSTFLIHPIRGFRFVIKIGGSNSLFGWLTVTDGVHVHVCTTELSSFFFFFSFFFKDFSSA